MIQQEVAMLISKLINTDKRVLALEKQVKELK